MVFGATVCLLPVYVCIFELWLTFIATNLQRVPLALCSVMSWTGLWMFICVISNKKARSRLLVKMSDWRVLNDLPLASTSPLPLFPSCFFTFSTFILIFIWGVHWGGFSFWHFVRVNVKQAFVFCFGGHTHTHKQLKEETKLCLSLYLSLSVAVRGRYSRSPKLLHHHEELCAAAAVGGLDDPGVLSARLHRWVTALGSIKGGGDTPPSPDGRGAERRVCCSFNGHLWELPGVVSFSFWRDSKQVNKHLKHSVQLQTHGQHSAQSVSLPNAFDSQAFCELAGLIKRTTSVRADGWWSSRSARLQSHRLSDWLADTGEPLEQCTLAVIWIRLSLRYFM